ncbi:MAG: hypothetical protein Q9225_001930 [Loekoesia sp. 1 TL-2023]
MAPYFSINSHPFLFTFAFLSVLLIAMFLDKSSLSPLLFVTSLLNTSDPVVHNARTGVSYRGTSKAGIEHFQNIFYAADTSGSNRFAPPVPYMPRAGTVVDATASGAWCPQAVGAAPLPFTRSWVANDGAWYAQPGLKDDVSVLATFRTFVLGLSQSSLRTLLLLYPVKDFTHLVRPNEAATAQYYRAAQLNRDIWFTCPVIDFTWQYARHGGSSNIRLYDMNQTKYGPIFQYMGVPQWRVSHLSDIPYLLNEDVAAGGDNSAVQRELSALLSGSAAAFAYTGDPTVSRGRVLASWPLAYRDQSTAALGKDYPEKLNLFVLGGPYGSGPATITAVTGGDGRSVREEALAWEKVVERCTFINSIREQIGV